MRPAPVRRRNKINLNGTTAPDPSPFVRLGRRPGAAHAPREETPDSGRTHITIDPPDMRIAQYRIIGTAPYMQSKFSHRTIEKMAAKQAAGSQSQKGTKRDARDFDADYEGALHSTEDGWHGIPAAAFRAGAIDACRMCGFKMTHAKMSVFIEADGYDATDSTALVRIIGNPARSTMMARNDDGSTDIRVRPIWHKWECNLRVRFDAGQFSLQDITNLIARVGMQVGVGEGRPFSRKSAGLGYGMFRIAESESEASA